uniref:Uncharacterized protein n=1 Tax=Knipowitschia caucasica TaxID=637954 RepID=A0AAV2J624_KNICA
MFEPRNRGLRTEQCTCTRRSAVHAGDAQETVGHMFEVRALRIMDTHIYILSVMGARLTLFARLLWLLRLTEVGLYQQQLI